MIQTQTMLDIADNSGARRVHVHQGARWFAPALRRVGDIIKVTVKEAIPRGKVKKGQVMNAVVVRTEGRSSPRRFDDPFDDNAAVLLNKHQPDRYAYLRPGDPRAAQRELHAHRFARARSALQADAHQARLKIKKATTTKSSSWP